MRKGVRDEGICFKPAYLHCVTVRFIYSVLRNLEERLQRNRKRESCGVIKGKIHGMDNLLPDLAYTIFEFEVERSNHESTRM